MLAQVAAEIPWVTIISSLLTGLMVVIWFFVSKFLDKGNSSHESIIIINERHGQTSAKADRAHARIDELAKDIVALRERVVVLEHKVQDLEQ